VSNPGSIFGGVGCEDFCYWAGFWGACEVGGGLEINWNGGGQVVEAGTGHGGVVGVVLRTIK
jgi:hypothetical protein